MRTSAAATLKTSRLRVDGASDHRWSQLSGDLEGGCNLTPFITPPNTHTHTHTRHRFQRTLQRSKKTRVYSTWTNGSTPIRVRSSGLHMIRNSPLLHYKAHRTALASTTFVKLIFPAIPIGGPIKVLLCLYARAVWTASRYFITCIRQQVERVVPGMLFLPCEVEAFLGREKKNKTCVW